MKNRLYMLFILFLSLNIFAVRPNSVWDPDNFPIVFRMDNQNLPHGIVNNFDNRIAFTNSIQKWNEHEALGPLVSIFDGTVDLTGGFTWNDVNEIKFTRWEANIPMGKGAVAKSRFYLESITHPRICVPESDYNNPKCPLERREVDILFNPTAFNHFLNESVPFNCNQLFNANTSLRHEIGHALGIEHFGSRLMGENLEFCKIYQVRSRDYRKLKKMYPSSNTVNVNIQSPNPNQVYIINQVINLQATIVPFINNPSLSEELFINDMDLIWKSSEDGFLGNGNNIQINNLSGGFHEITASIGKPGDAIYGDGGVSIYVIDSVSEIIDGNGNQIAAPFPCPRAVSRSSGECLFNVKRSFSFGNCTYPVSGTDTYVEDLPAGADVGSGHHFTRYVGPFPSCNHGNPLATYYYDIQSWINDVYNPDQVNYHMRNRVHRIGIDLPSERHYFYTVPLVEPEIHVNPITDCNVTNISQKCSVTVTYEDKYFLPNAGLFYRNQGTTNWIKVGNLAEGSDGQKNTGNIIGVNGVELAVFQYANDIYRADIPPSLGNPVIIAPNGMVAGPFTVKAISSNTTPVDPELVSAETSCSNNYCITLLGHYFDPNALVHIRDPNNNDLLKIIQGNDIYKRGVFNGLDRLHFPIQSLTLQDKLNNEGLCFFVVNNPEFSDPICITRPETPAQPAFLGQTVGHYRFNVEDVEYTSYEITGDTSNKLKIWGNSWKKVFYHYNVTPSTVLKFDFRSNQQEPEINGIGFIKSGESLATENWQVYGTETWGRQEHNNYSGSGWKSYSIPIGQYFTGQVRFMVFAGDEDNHVGQNSIYRNPRLVDVDLYEDDDTHMSNNNVIGINNPRQYHDFSDDSVDWIKLMHTDFIGYELGVQPQECNNLSCQIVMSDVNSTDLCLQFFKEGSSSQIQCGLTDGVYTDEQLIIPSNISGPPPSICDGDYMLGWSHLKISDNSNSPSPDKNYKVRFNCSYDENLPDNTPDVYEEDDVFSQTTNEIEVNGIKQHHNFRYDVLDTILMPSMNDVMTQLNLNENSNCENLSCKIKVSNAVNVNLCLVFPPIGGIGPLPDCSESISSFSSELLFNNGNPSQCSQYTFLHPRIGINNGGGIAGANKSYDIELICDK